MTFTSIFIYCQLIGIQHADIVTAQTIVECGWNYDSHNARERNNLTGWTINGQLHTFNTWHDCIRTYKEWQGKYYKGGDYYQFLRCIDFGNGVCHSYAANIDTYCAKVEQVRWMIVSC
jgi:hypothetical protein